MKYSIDAVMNKSVDYKGKQLQPLLEYKKNLNKLDIMTLEQYLNDYNPNTDIFSLNDLVNKLGNNCTVYNKQFPSGVPQVGPDYIKEKISRHYTEYTSKIKKPENRKYKIYFAVDNSVRDSYANEEIKEKIKKRNNKKRQKLIKRYSYRNPLNRIHGFIVIDDKPCFCKKQSDKFLSINIICANPFASKAGIKAVGSYLLMFIFMFAYHYKFHKIILEVTNDIAGIPDDLSDEEDSDEEDSDDEDSDEEDSDEEDSDDEDPECCDVRIDNNMFCEEVTEDPEEDIIDKFEYESRYKELNGRYPGYSRADLKELLDCYNVKYNERDNKKELVKKVLEFEFWKYDKYIDPYENEDCKTPWSIYDNLDYTEYGYNGINYHEGRDSTKDLYCKFYEKHGFRENEELNTELKCFTYDPLPSMELDLSKYTLENLLKVFFERKYLIQPSEYCRTEPNSVNIDRSNIIIHE